MYIRRVAIERHSIVSDIVKQDHHTADVFRKYGIEFCCGGKWSLETACMMKGLEFEDLKKELDHASRPSHLPSMLPFETWDVDFLTNYIINIHHSFLRSSLPVTEELVKNFADGHVKKFPHMQDVLQLFEKLKKEILPHIAHEEEIIFPYICQVAHAYDNNDSYARLLVKTLRKPLESMIHKEHDMMTIPLLKIRELTNNYTPPDHACVSHKVALARLQELDSDLVQHLYLENDILFPRTLRIEQELLK